MDYYICFVDDNAVLFYGLEGNTITFMTKLTKAQEKEARELREWCIKQKMVFIPGLPYCAKLMEYVDNKLERQKKEMLEVVDLREAILIEKTKKEIIENLSTDELVKAKAKMGLTTKNWETS